MTQPKFTPGPYCDNGDGFIRQTEQNEGSRLFIAQVIEIPFNFGGDKVTEANINLLKAAPDMYEALESLLECVDEFAKRVGWPDNKPREAARAALAKVGRA